jgi:hypothetical protein
MKGANWARLVLLSGAFVACRFGYELETVVSGIADGGAADAPVDAAGADGTTTGGTSSDPPGGAPAEAGQPMVDGGAGASSGGAPAAGTAGRGGSGGTTAGSGSGGTTAGSGSGGTTAGSGSGGCTATGAEVCDGRDNDCSGSIDDGNVCATGCEGHEHGGHGYLFCTTPLSWSAAEAACETQGFKLVRVDDATEMLWLHDICFAAVGSNNTAAVWPWLGANDQAVAGEWRWADGTLFWQGNQTGTPVAGLYNNWTQGEPIAKDSCGAMQNNPDKSLWAAQPCTSLHPYTCESP